jgi:branched-chain amino acid transport system ATP-binding protein
VSAILEVEHLQKNFGALAAVNDLSFMVNEGETLGIAGPNGAGKTALFDVITGQSRASGGVVRFKGEEIQNLTASAICQRGLARTFQIAGILPSQTVLGTILGALHFGRQRRLVARLRFSADEVSRAHELARRCDLQDRLGVETPLLSIFERKRLMVAAAMATEPALLMLDEPCGGLTEAEGWQLLGLVDDVKAAGASIVLVEHIMSMLMKVSTRVMIIHQGGKIFEGDPADAIEDREVIRLYLGSTGIAAGVGRRDSDA